MTESPIVALERERWMDRRRSGWSSKNARLVSGLLIFLTLSGLAIQLLPFNLFSEHSVVVHTLLGVVFTPLFAVFFVQHVRTWWDVPFNHLKFTGWLAALMTVSLIVTGFVLTAQSVFGTRITYDWRLAHIVGTVGLLLFLVPHYLTLAARDASSRENGGLSRVAVALRSHMLFATVTMGLALGATAVLCGAVGRPKFENQFPADYDLDPYKGSGPFAPSLATTITGGALDSHSLSGSETCGTAGCHEEIYEEWQPSAHRYAAMDTVFQAIQGLMAQQNGATSTRYCAGCHDPISLFSGTKFIGVENLTGQAGYQEGVSCLACHAIEKTDVAGNANYIIHQPERYAWELRDGKVAAFLRDFTLRAYPDQHVASLSRRMFKTPEFCAACHKQFIDETVNKVGWVQLQNQYDNWKTSRWNHAGDPSQTLECRECHMPLVASTDPSRGDDADFNRTTEDGKHRSHAFLGGNQFIPRHLALPGGEAHAQRTEAWLRGEIEVPEIASRWREGPAVPIELDVPDTARPGETIPVRVHVTNNKVGHDFPTGPLDIIQAWIEVEVKDAQGNVLLSSGNTDDKHFIATGSFMFKAEPIDRYGNLIDRHNLWEMVGVRFKRSLFPGAQEVARYEFGCPSSFPEMQPEPPKDREVALEVPAHASGELRVEAKLHYRKVDQYLINFAFGADTPLTSPVTLVASASDTIRVSSDAK
jgi:hypothetical protein